MRRSFRFACLVGIFVGLCPPPGAAQQTTSAPPEFTTWFPLGDFERDQKTPLVEKDAGAEVMLWRVHVVDEVTGDNRSLQRVFYHYIRLKIFNDSGKEKAATIDLPFRDHERISEVAGRTIKADGSVIELDRKTVYKRDLERIGGFRESVVSFAMPQVAPGAILEYRWKQTEDDNRFRYLRLHFQREFPVQKVTYFVKPLSNQSREELFVSTFNCNTSPIKQGSDGYASITVENVPAVRVESYSPSSPNVEAWGLLYYRPGGLKDPNRYWDEEGKKLYKDFKESLKSDDEVKAVAAKVAAEASDEDGKLAAQAAYVRKTVRNLNSPDLTAADREAFIQRLPRDRARNSAEILKSGIGTSSEINVAFAAVAAQGGFEVRPALVADRGDISFDPKFAESYFLDNKAVAVKSRGVWKIMDLGDTTVSPSMLPWHEEGMYALLGDPKAPNFVTTPVSPPDSSAESRSAKLELSRNGSIAGDVDESYTGHRAAEYRRAIGFKSTAQREEWLRARVARAFRNAEVTGIKFDDVDDPARPLAVHYHLQAAGFAQVTGKRILLQANAFRRTQPSPFSAAQRHNPIEFHYGWKEADNVNIQLPAGFSLDNADNPGGVKFGKSGSYEVAIVIAKGERQELRFTRTLTFGSEGMLLFSASTYPALKKVFDDVQLRDGHTISLKEN
jgi:hypothetical protein